MTDNYTKIGYLGCYKPRHMRHGLLAEFGISWQKLYCITLYKPQNALPAFVYQGFRTAGLRTI